MYLVQKNRVRWQSKTEYEILLRLARLSKNVYNTTLWHVRNIFNTEGTYRRYEALYATMKTDANYTQLPSQVAQQAMKRADRAMHSFFQLLKMKHKGTYTRTVSFPHYLPKDGYAPCVFPKQSFKVFAPTRTVRVSLGRYFTLHEGQHYLYFKLPKHIIDATIKEVRLIPQWHGHAFDIEYVYLAKQTNLRLNSEKYLAIDLGLTNFATCVRSTNVTNSSTTTNIKNNITNTINESAFILEGRGLKSWNRWWNKTWASVQSIKDKQHRQNLSHREARMLQKRRSITRNYVFQTVNYIIKYCLIHEIGSIIIGALPDLKRHIHLGKKTNQHFYAIPIGNFKRQLHTKCDYYGINYTEVDEVYTSQTCSQCRQKRKNSRLHCGLYICGGIHGCGARFNADVNAAINIGTKVAPNAFHYSRILERRGSSGRVNRPIRIRQVVFATL